MILDKVLNESNAAKFYFQNPYPNIDGNNSLIHFGATRGCICDKNGESVYKFDLTEDNSCNNEFYIYEQALSAGVEKFFATPIKEIVFEKDIYFYDANELKGKIPYDAYLNWNALENWFKYTNLSNFKKKKIHICIKLYQFEYCNCTPSDFHFIKSFDIFENINSPLTEHNKKIASTFVQDWGEDLTKQLSNFCIEMDINDIHEYNVGRRLSDNKLVIIDYAGYHENQYS